MLLVLKNIKIFIFVGIKFLIDECGVKENDIRELVDLYTNKYSSINVGYGLQKI